MGAIFGSGKKTRKRLRHMKKLIILVLAALTTAASYGPNTSGDTLRLTLEECLYYAMGNNYSRQSTQLNEETRASVLDQSRMERLPGVSANISENFSNSENAGTAWNGNYDLSANMVLFQGGQINNTIRQNELQYEQTKLRTQQYDNELTIQILQTFLTALGNEELLKYQQVIVSSSKQQAEEGRAKYAAGQVLESDYLLLEAQYATDLNNINTTRINLENNLISLKSLMSMDLSQPISLIYPDADSVDSMLSMPSQDAVVERGLETLPDVRISEYNVEVAESGVRISKSAY